MSQIKPRHSFKKLHYSSSQKPKPPSQAQVVLSLKRLIEYLLPDSIDEDSMEKYLSYCMRLLSSSIVPLAIKDSSSVRTLIQKRLLRVEGRTQLEKNTKALRFENLFELFQGFSFIKNKSSILYCLYFIGNNTSSDEIQSLNFGKLIPNIDGALNHRAAVRINEQAMEIDGPQFLNNEKKPRKLTSKYIDNICGHEAELVRDLLYILGGIDGKYITYSTIEDSYNIASNVMVSESLQKMTLEICEIGWLYKKVYYYISRFKESNFGGEVCESFSFALEAELTEYYRLISILDNQRANSNEAGDNSFNIKKMNLWLQEPLERMKWLAILTDSAEMLKGGALASMIYSFTIGTSTNIRKLLTRILHQVCNPILKMIKVWMLKGELNDMFFEFFVSENKNVEDAMLWSSRYYLRVEMIPSFLTPEIAHMIFLAGKAVNFIRRCSNQSKWVLDPEMIESYASMDNFSQLIQNLPLFQKWVTKAYELTNKKLLELLFIQYKFKEHCNSIKKYLLLGQGDFIQTLLDVMSPELKKPAQELYKHNLLTVFETALRGSNAQYHSKDFLQCLDIRLLESSQGETGWDIFSLNYKVEFPLNTIITPEQMENYLRVFNFLWKLKRVDHALRSTWSQQMGNKMELFKLPMIRNELHKSNMIRHEMMHFISTLHNYIMVEALESSWKMFLDHLYEAKDLDELYNLHEKMVNQIMDKALLTPKYMNFYQKINQIFDLIFKFKFSQDILYTTAIDEYHRIMVTNMEPIQGQFYEDQQNEESKISHEACIHLQNVCNEYHQAFSEFNNHLTVFHEQELKMLAFRLDFNEYYDHVKELALQRNPKLRMDMNAANQSDLSDNDSEEDSEPDEGNPPSKKIF